MITFPQEGAAKIKSQQFPEFASRTIDGGKCEEYDLLENSDDQNGPEVLETALLLISGYIAQGQFHCFTANSSPSNYCELNLILVVLTQFPFQHFFYESLNLDDNHTRNSSSPRCLLDSVPKEKRCLGKAGYPVLKNGLNASRSYPGVSKSHINRNSCQAILYTEAKLTRRH